MWVFAALARRGKAISTPRKIAIGMGLAGLAFLFMTVFSIINGYPSAEAFKDLPAAEAAALKTGPWVLFVLYFFLTVAELFISPLGLSFVSKVAPKHLQGLCQGLWLCATAVAICCSGLVRSSTMLILFGWLGLYSSRSASSRWALCSVW